MVKVSVLYPNEDGKKFDMDYYLATHIPLVRKLLGSSCTNVGVDHGIGGGTPGSKAPYVAIGHLFFNTVEDFMSSFGPNATAIVSDIPNYTDTNSLDSNK
ncbi:MAG TPA: EthD family reductase [Chitinophagaceae bacterium]|nr:EthD family reductase [Chitinophagaceae bacterium]